MSITDHLRKLVRDSEASRYAIAQATGVQQSALLRFVAGKDLRGESLDKLAEYYGLELKAKRKGKG